MMPYRIEIKEGHWIREVVKPFRNLREAINYARANYSNSRWYVKPAHA